jgi:hypothetical protein
MLLSQIWELHNILIYMKYDSCHIVSSKAVLLARKIKSIFRENRSLCGTSIKVGMGTPLMVLVW